MPKDMAARLLAIADRLTDKPDEAAELRAIAETHSGQRRAAGKAKAAIQRAAGAETRAEALACAVDARRRNPAISQAVVATVIKLDFGPAVPVEDRLRRWVREWERAGSLPRATWASAEHTPYPQPSEPVGCLNHGELDETDHLH